MCTDLFKHLDLESRFASLANMPDRKYRTRLGGSSLLSPGQLPLFLSNAPRLH